MQKIKPGIVASYDIWPGNREDLFWFRRFTNFSLTYLPTYLQPQVHTEPLFIKACIVFLHKKWQV